MLQTIIIGKVDILLVTKTKLDNSFPSNQLLLASFSPPYRLIRKQGISCF